MVRKIFLMLFLVSLVTVYGCSISGTVEDQFGGPLSDVDVTLAGGADATATTGEDGTYEFTMLFIGAYTVSADLSANGDCGIIEKEIAFLLKNEIIDFKSDECLGACCNDTSGLCMPYITEDACDTAGGTFMGEGVDCLDVMPCGDPKGACCEDDAPAYTCTPNVTEATCDGTGGTWNDGGTCGLDVICDPTPVGACCNDDETCSPYISEVSCTDTGGTWQGADSDCMLAQCDLTWACCMPDYSCDQSMTESECTAAGGTFNDGLPCGMAQCDPTGACIVGTECTDDVSQSDCEAPIPMGYGGTYQGDGTTCP